MSNNAMNHSAEEQRRIGMKLAGELGATKTLAIIGDENSSYEQILKSAAAEVGVDKLASTILQNHPMWALEALRFVPNLGNHREPLIKRAGELAPLPSSAPHRLHAASAQTSVGGLELYLISGAAFEARFTMYWLSAPNVNQPMAGTPDPSQWIWSDKLSISINRSFSYDCSHFELPLSPLAAGNTVWMIVHVVCGNDYDTGFRFTYDPKALSQRIDTWGASVNPQFGLHQQSEAAKSA